MAERGVVAAGHRLTAQAAAETLAAGGNAFDAVIAGFCMACVAEPVLCSVGGGGFLNARRADGWHAVYDFFAQTPRYKRPVADCDFAPITADFGEDQQEFHIGQASIATPGAVAGIFRVHRELGSLPMREIVRPAVTAARAGVQVSPFQAYLLTVVQPIYQATPAARAAFGSPVEPEQLIRVGETLRLPEFAGLLEALAEEGDALFYRGEIAATIARVCTENGGHLRREDLAAYRVERRRALELDYRGAHIALNPPPSTGGLLIAFGLRLLESVTVSSLTPGGQEHLALLAGVLDGTQQARVAAAGDEDTLLDPAFIARYRRELAGRAAAHRGTTHISVLDAAGNVAAMTVSNGEGCGDMLPGGGFMLNNMLGEEDLHPRGFHRWPEDQRLASMMCPTLLWRPDGRLLALGSGGSNRIRSAILQVLVNLLDFDMDVEAAIGQSRIHFESGLLSLEGGIAAGVADTLAREYPRQRRWESRNLFFGGVHLVGDEAGALHGAGDPRRDGVAVTV